MVYLKANVVVEPLCLQWYAWPHLISPATAAMNVLHRHLRIMDSFIQGPAVHERFSRDPKMVGSPFMNHPASRVDDVRALRDRTRHDAAHMIELAVGIGALTALLEAEAHGYSLDVLYARVPEALRGLVELVYDRQNRARFRIIEPLLYRSRYHDVAAQSIALYAIERDERPFMLTTPRLADDGALQLRIPFADAAIDVLFAMRTAPAPYHRIRDKFELDAAQETAFRQLFTEQPPPKRSDVSTGGVQLRYFGHACVLLETGGISILTDPSISPRAGGDVPRYTFADLPDRIDYVLITHNHQDHVLLETLLQLRHRIGRVIVPRSSGGDLEAPSLKLMFEALGFGDVVQIEELESLDLGGCTVTGVPFAGEHADLDIRSKLVYHVRASNGLTMLFAADSSTVDPALTDRLHAIVGDVDLLFLGMECDGAPLSWLYGPLLSARLPRDMDHSRRLAGSDYERGMAMVERFRPSEVYVYAMGQEPWLRHIMGLEYTSESRPIIESSRLVDACRARGIAAKRLFGRELWIRDMNTTVRQHRNDAA
jgi:L-ascorbate metabolism protein UlaG (beta-lactamase superfamily)